MKFVIVIKLTYFRISVALISFPLNNSFPLDGWYNPDISAIAVLFPRYHSTYYKEWHMGINKNSSKI